MQETIFSETLQRCIHLPQKKVTEVQQLRAEPEKYQFLIDGFICVFPSCLPDWWPEKHVLHILIKVFRTHDAVTQRSDVNDGEI